jgi:L-rhamnose mutarotase
MTIDQKKQNCFAWHARIREGTEEEYRRRHDEIWPEMTAVLNEAGIHNYTIWLYRSELFGYYECSDLAKAAQIQASSPVVARWNEYMKDILIMEFDEKTGVTPPLKLMFYHK